MELFLMVCTVLGGFAALFYFWDKIVAFLRRVFTVQPEIRWVGLDFPSKSGLQKKLEDNGYDAKWCRDDQVQKRIDTADYEPVVVKEKWFRKILFKHEDHPKNLTLIKKKKRHDGKD